MNQELLLLGFSPTQERDDAFLSAKNITLVNVLNPDDVTALCSFLVSQAPDVIKIEIPDTIKQRQCALITSPASGQIERIESLCQKASGTVKAILQEFHDLYDNNAARWRWHTRNRIFTTHRHPLIMGILNVTPDSFSDGGLFFDMSSALKRAEDILNEGADIIDIGGESTRPGAMPVSAREEIERVMPIIKSIKEQRPCVVSVDTYKCEVAEDALAVGADIVNDITGLRVNPRIASLVVKYNAGIVLMHMQGTPQTMQQSPHYDNVVDEVSAFLERQIQFALDSGIREEQIVIDPGIGFGKSVEHNLDLLKNLDRIRLRCGRPLLIGVSRKRFIGALLDDIPAGERMFGSIGAALAAVLRGADIVRVHDVLPTRHALEILQNVYSIYKEQ